MGYENVLESFGVEFLNNPETVTKPAQTKAKATLRKLYESEGPEHLTIVLRCILETHPNSAWHLSKHIITGVSLALKRLTFSFDVLDCFDNIDLQEISARSTDLVAFGQRPGIVAVMIAERLRSMEPPAPRRRSRPFIRTATQASGAS